MNLRVGTRGSRLARLQTGDFVRMLTEKGHEVVTDIIKTAGDRDQDRAFADVGAPGIFVVELENALMDRRVDVAVHSYKDLPSKNPAELMVACIPERVDAADRFLVREGAYDPSMGFLPVRKGGRIGSASARRQALLRHMRPDLEICLLRGNLPTRVRRLQEGEFDAILLAAAGLFRLDRGAERDPSIALPRGGIQEIRLDPEQWVPAPSQGALAVQIRAADRAVRAAVEPLDDAAAHRAVNAERALLARVEGGCQVPFGAWCRTRDDGGLELFALLEIDGRLLRTRRQGLDPQDLALESWKALQAGGDPS